MSDALRLSMPLSDAVPGVVPDPASYPAGVRVLLATPTGTWLAVPLALLRLAPWNYKKGDARLDVRLENGLTRNGLVENLIVRQLPATHVVDAVDAHVVDAFEVANGNHRVERLTAIAERDGIDPHTVMVVVFDLGMVDADEARLRAIETNELRYPNDHIAFADTVNDLRAAFGDERVLDTTPFTEGDLEHFDAMSQWEWDATHAGEHQTGGGGHGKTTHAFQHNLRPREDGPGEGGAGQDLHDLRVALHDDDLATVRAAIERLTTTGEIDPDDDVRDHPERDPRTFAVAIVALATRYLDDGDGDGDGDV